MTKKYRVDSTERVVKSQKKYLQRLIEQEEAEKEIDEYCTDECDVDRFDGERFIGRERRSGKLS